MNTPHHTSSNDTQDTSGQIQEFGATFEALPSDDPQHKRRLRGELMRTATGMTPTPKPFRGLSLRPLVGSLAAGAAAVTLVVAGIGVLGVSESASAEEIVAESSEVVDALSSGEKAELAGQLGKEPAELLAEAQQADDLVELSAEEFESEVQLLASDGGIGGTMTEVTGSGELSIGVTDGSASSDDTAVLPLNPVDGDAEGNGVTFTVDGEIEVDHYLGFTAAGGQRTLLLIDKDSVPVAALFGIAEE